jgi:hypothetical protein
MWCSFGIMNPLKKPQEMFDGLDKYFSASEMGELKAHFTESINEIEKWCTSDIVTKEKVGKRSPFLSIGLTIKFNKLTCTVNSGHTELCRFLFPQIIFRID